MTDLALTYWSMRRLVEADELGKDVLERLEQAQGLQHPDTPMSMHKFTWICKSQREEKTKGDEGAGEYDEEQTINRHHHVF